jgi:hypothetical protein
VDLPVHVESQANQKRAGAIAQFKQAGDQRSLPHLKPVQPVKLCDRRFRGGGAGVIPFGSLPLVLCIVGYPTGITGIEVFLLCFPQGRPLPGKSEPDSTTISTYFFIAEVVKGCLST